MATRAPFSIEESAPGEMSWKSKWRTIAYAAVIFILLGAILTILSINLSDSGTATPWKAAPTEFALSVEENHISFTSLQAQVTTAFAEVKASPWEASPTESTLSAEENHISFTSPQTEAITVVVYMGRNTASEEALPTESTRRPNQVIYFLTYGDGIKTYDLETSTGGTSLDSRLGLFGIAYDSLKDKIYFSSARFIYRANRNGTNREIVSPSAGYGISSGLAFDWITGNLYLATGRGYVLVCITSHLDVPLLCRALTTGQGKLEGIALNPISGHMYWTKDGNLTGAIVRAEMDASNPTVLFADLRNPRGLTIDFESWHLYWSSAGDDTIQMSNLDGSSRQTVLQLPKGSWPHGIAITADRVCWSAHFLHKLQCSVKGQEAITTLYTGSKDIKHIATVPVINLPTNRNNSCAWMVCSRICVLKAQSSRCLT